MDSLGVETFRIGSFLVCLERTPAISEEQIESLLAELGQNLQTVEFDFVVKIFRGNPAEAPVIEVEIDGHSSLKHRIKQIVEQALVGLTGAFALIGTNGVDPNWPAQACTELRSWASRSDFEELPDGLTRINLEQGHGQAASPERRDLEKKLAGLIQRHFSGERKSTLAICLEGPPGSGKTTLAKEATRLSGFEAFRMSDFHSKYVNESSTKLKQIFHFLRSRKAVVIYDEIDTLVGQRGMDGEVASKDHNKTVGTLYAEMEETKAILFGTTNLFPGLDKAFVSRVGGNHFPVPAPSLDERLAFLLEANQQATSPLLEDELKELAEGSVGCSFRDLNALCEALDEEPRFSGPRSVDAWRRAFDGRRSLNSSASKANWSTPHPSAVESTNRIWHLVSPTNGSQVIVSSKADCCHIGLVGATGHLGSYKKIETPDDVNAACLAIAGTRLVTSTDDGIFMYRLDGSKAFGPLDLGGYVWDTAPLGATGLMASICASGKKVTIWSVNAEGYSTNGTSLEGFRALRSIHYLGSLQNGIDASSHLLLVGGESDFCLIEFSLVGGSGSLAKLAELPSVETLDHRRLSVIQTLNSEHHVAFLAKDRVHFYRITQEGKFSLEHQFFLPSGSSPVCSFDQATGRFVVGLKGEVRIYDRYLSPDDEPSFRITCPNADDPITAICFAKYGRVIVWGTKNGKVYTSVCSDF